MASDLTVTLEDRPGALADMGDALGRAGVNIDGIAGATGPGSPQIHILVEDAETAQAALTEAGIEVGPARDVVMMSFENRPGEMGEIGRRIADTGTNIEVVYISCDGQLILATSNNAAVTGAG
jgi:hypothetical protein